MDEYDNITRMPGQQPPPPRFNLSSLSLTNEEGHLTITFWLLAAAIVVAIYLVIEMLETQETQTPVVPVVPDLTEKQNHATPTRKPRTPQAKEAVQGD